MNYHQTLEYLYTKLPMFSRLGAAAIKKDLHNTLALCQHLNNPQHQFKSIHVGGTNGKGSTSHMLAAILQTAGYKVGLYTSPHLKDFRERIRINGQMIAEEQVVNFVKAEKTAIEAIQPSFFELTVAMAFDHFAKAKVDIAVIEVGLGGRLDSTNVITPELSVITNISLDHTNVLGNTLGEIAAEKAGIIKPHIPVVIGEKHPETQAIFLNKAAAAQAEICFAEDHFQVISFEQKDSVLNVEVSQEQQASGHYLLDLTGKYQLKNILTVLQSIERLTQRGFDIPVQAVKAGLKKVKELTGLQGRWQTLSKEPLVICDTGHNIGGIQEIVANLAQLKFEKLHLVIGMVKDKDISGILAMLPQKGTYYFCHPDLERALNATELQRLAKEFDLEGDRYHSVKEALAAAKIAAGPDDLIFIGGSTFVVAEVL